MLTDEARPRGGATREAGRSRASRWRRAWPGLVAGAVTMGASGAARAELRDDARRIEAQWKRAGQQVERLPPLFLEPGRRQRVNAGERFGCVTVALVTNRGADFGVRSLSEPSARMERPVAGLMQATRCGDEARVLEQLVVELRGGRGAFEVLVATGVDPAPDAREALVERLAVPVRPALDPGRGAETETLAARTARAEGRARADGATTVESEALTTGDEGQGRLLRAMSEGCHRLDLIADPGTGGRVGDIDADLRVPGTDVLIARDRSETADGRLEFCVGEPTGVALSFRGGPARGAVRMVHARWALPEALPTVWGTKARSAMAFALGRRRAPTPRGRPVQTATGVAGTAAVSFETAPGACYLALLGTGRGEVRGLSLSAEVDGLPVHDEGGGGREGLAMTFCARRAAQVPIQIDARGSGLLWGLALWRLPTNGEATR